MAVTCSVWQMHSASFIMSGLKNEMFYEIFQRRKKNLITSVVFVVAVFVVVIYH